MKLLFSSLLFLCITEQTHGLMKTQQRTKRERERERKKINIEIYYF